jgi:hypothetical protein
VFFILKLFQYILAIPKHKCDKIMINMARLPQPGGDNGTWGDILNQYLQVSHNDDGTVKDTGIVGSKANDDEVVHDTGDETIAGNKTFSSPIIARGGIALGDDNGNPNIVLMSESNPLVDALQLGQDGSGVLREQHISSADQTGTGLAAKIVINPGASKGTDQNGADITLSSGFSTGAGAGGTIIFAASSPSSTGTTVNSPSAVWYIANGGHLYPADDNTRVLGLPSGRVAAGYFGQFIQIGTNPAQSGALGLANGNQLKWRNAANTADITALEVTSANQVKVGGVDYASYATNGQAGVYAPSVAGGSPIITPIANFLYFGRFVAPKAMTAKSIRFGLMTSASINDSCAVALYDSTGTQIATSGTIAGKLNAAPGPQSITVPDTALTAGSIYYAALWFSTIGGTAATIAGSGYVASNGAPNLAGTGIGVADYGIVSAAVLPATLAGFSAWSYAPYLFVSES